MKSIAALSLVSLTLALPTFTHAQAIPESVYPPPEPYIGDEPRELQTGFRFALDTRYLTDFIWRGIERFDAGRNEDEANLQFDTRIGFDLGKLPHPYVRLFVNVAENDPISSFEEVRPEVGFDWPVRPFVISTGYTSYIFPDREDIDTSEVFLKLAFDDSVLFHTERPVLNPYILGAYDFDVYQGLYVEAGINHTLPIENTGLVFIANAHAAYVNSYDLFAINPDESNTGFQHWQVGITAKYTLNTLLNIPDRFGKMSLTGFINYTDSIDEELIATDQLWGGAGFTLEF
jgi:hypothetical protein